MLVECRESNMLFGLCITLGSLKACMLLKDLDKKPTSPTNFHYKRKQKWFIIENHECMKRERQKSTLGTSTRGGSLSKSIPSSDSLSFALLNISYKESLLSFLGVNVCFSLPHFWPFFLLVIPFHWSWRKQLNIHLEEWLMALIWIRNVNKLKSIEDKGCKAQKRDHPLHQVCVG